MFRRNKNRYDDPITNTLMSKGIYTVQYQVEKESRWKTAWKEHNILSGMYYVFILSCLLWWLPVFGQMIAGYVGGRRAGSASKGILVAIIPVFIIMFLLTGMDMGFFPFLVSITSVPSTLLNGLSSVSPQAASYLNGIFDGLKPLVGLNANGFLIVVVFGIIGGMMADMNRKELQRATGSSQMLDSLFDRMSGSSLTKFADMVAERVMWTFATMESGGRSLLPARSAVPAEMSFENMQMLPVNTASYDSYQPVYPEPAPHTQGQAFGYNDYYPNDYTFSELENLAVERVPVSYEEPEPIGRKIEDDWGISHLDVSDDSLSSTWARQKKSMESRKVRKNTHSIPSSRSNRYYKDKAKRPDHTKEKRDAMVFDGKGNIIQEGKKIKRTTSSKDSSLVKRALEADKKFESESKKEPVKTQNPTPVNNLPEQPEIKPRPKPSQSYERL